MNNNQKLSFPTSNNKYMNDSGGFRSVFTTWPSLFPAYTISYSAATGKPIENGKKKLFVLLVLLLLLITSLAASLVLAFLWFNAIQSEYGNESIKQISSSINQPSFDQHSGQPNNHHRFNHHSIHHQPNHQTTHQLPSYHNRNSRPITSTTTSTTTTSTTTTRSTLPQSTTQPIETESTNEDDGFGEKETADNNSPQPPSSSDEQLINYYKNMKHDLDRNRDRNRDRNKMRHEEKLDGEFIEHHTVSDLPDDAGEFLQPEQPVTTSNNNDDQQPNLVATGEYSHNLAQNEPSSVQLNLPESLVNLKAKQFCNFNSHMNTFKNSSYECRSNLDPSLISSYFCNDKFVIVAKINSVKENVINEQNDQNEKQSISRYDVHIERILKRSPFLSVAFKKQGLTTNITINLSMLADKFRNPDKNPFTCLDRPLELEVGHYYLLSGHVSGLSAVSGNCDLQLEWFNDLNEDQRNQLINWSTSRATFSHC